MPTDPSEQPIVAKTTLKKLADQLPGKEKLDADVEDLLSNIAEEFVREAIRSSARLSKHRKGDMLELKDVQLFLGTLFFAIQNGQSGIFETQCE